MIKIWINMALALGMLCLCNLYAHSQGLSIDIPAGNQPIVDGKIMENEWKKASRIPLYGGEYVAFQKAEDTLYIAIKGKTGGFCSVAIGSKDKFRILHASTGLITAEYEKTNNHWKRTYDFKEPLTQDGEKYARGSVRLSNAYKKSMLEQFHWYANLIDMGDASETEYKITISELGPEDVYLSVVFFQIKAQTKMAKIPQSLSDDCLDRELISGSANEELQFKPESWIQLIIFE